MLKNKNTHIGLIIILSMIILIIGLNFLKGTDIFKTSNTYYAKYSNISGLKKANPVSLLGFEIGKVADIYFDEKDPDTVIVKLEIDDSFRIPENSVAKISSTSLLGNKEITLILSKENSYLENNDNIIGQNEESMMSLLNTKFEPLSNKAHRLFISMDKLVSSFNDILDNETKTNISKSLKNIEQISKNTDRILANKNSNLNQLLNNLSSITKNIDSNGKEITKIISNFSSISDTLSKTNIINTLNKTSGELNTLMKNVNTGNGSLGKLIYNDSLYNNLKNSSNSLNNLLIDINDNPKRYLHFSIFNKEKTTFFNKIPNNTDVQYYSICILESDTKLDISHKIFADNKKIIVIKTKNNYIYTVEKTNNLKQLNKHIKRIKKKYPKAKIINSTYL